MHALLSGWNCLATTAASTEEALQLLSAGRLLPDVVLTDYHLESESGIDALRTLNEKLQANLPGVIITADRSPDLRAAAAAKGLPILHKPLRPAVLRALLSQMVVQRTAAE